MAHPDPGRKAIIVEDDQIQAIALKMLLESSGFTVNGMYRNAEKALEPILKTPVDLLVTDLRLQGKLGGLDLVRKVRKTRDLPVLFVTGQNRHRCEQWIQDLDDCELLIKPIVARELKQTLRKLT